MDEEVRNLLTAWNLESYIEVFKGSSSDKSNPPSPSLRLPERYISQEEEIPDAIVWLKIPVSLGQPCYTKEYPALKKSTGYVLLEKDFDELYGGTYTEIFESFPPLKENIFKLAKKKSAHNKDSTLNELLNLQDCILLRIFSLVNRSVTPKKKSVESSRDSDLTQIVLIQA
ncbi:hypothetical protein PV325_000264 [Microctonus aethiopoides]|nr:hypothetical protein PV325_000264 [Microctonus aethiopoides]